MTFMIIGPKELPLKELKHFLQCLFYAVHYMISVKRHMFLPLNRILGAPEENLTGWYLVRLSWNSCPGRDSHLSISFHKYIILTLLSSSAYKLWDFRLKVERYLRSFIHIIPSYWTSVSPSSWYDCPFLNLVFQIKWSPPQWLLCLREVLPTSTLVPSPVFPWHHLVFCTGSITHCHSFSQSFPSFFIVLLLLLSFYLPNLFSRLCDLWRMRFHLSCLLLTVMSGA